MSFTHYMENKILDHVFGGGNYARPANLQVGLSVTQIQDDGSGITEPAGEYGYARVLLPNDSESWQPAETDTSEGRGMKTNKIAIEFPEATNDWGAITHFFLADGLDVIGHGTLANSKEIRSGDVARFREGELVITLD